MKSGPAWAMSCCNEALLSHWQVSHTFSHPSYKIFPSATDHRNISSRETIHTSSFWKYKSHILSRIKNLTKVPSVHNMKIYFIICGIKKCTSLGCHRWSVLHLVGFAHLKQQENQSSFAKLCRILWEQQEMPWKKSLIHSNWVCLAWNS